MTATKNSARLTAIVAPRIFATTLRIPDDMQDRIARMMKRSVPAEFQPRRAPRVAWVRTQSPDIAARNRSMVDLSAQGLTSTQIGNLFGVSGHYARSVIRCMEASA